jgi:zinc transporter ZupT
MKLRVRAFGLAVGIVCGLGIFVATLWDVARGSGRTLELLSAFFAGYRISFGGAIVGLIWGFVYGFICGALIAWTYNIFHKALYKS